jgi:phosphatidylglycerophosphatase C
MNVYDWDNTIYRGDSTAGFVLYAYGHRPLTWLSIPRTAVCGLLYGLHLMKKLTFKQNLYHMFVFIPDMETFVEKYTSSHLNHVKAWYLEQQKGDDLVISASPDFLIRSFCRKIGIQHVMASVVDPHTGRYSGLNCHGQEKVRRYREVYGDTPITEFYSDSRSDAPLAALAEKAFLVRGEERSPW